MNLGSIFTKIFNPEQPSAEEIIKQELQKRLLDAQLAYIDASAQAEDWTRRKNVLQSRIGQLKSELTKV